MKQFKQENIIIHRHRFNLTEVTLIIRNIAEKMRIDFISNRDDLLEKKQSCQLYAQFRNQQILLKFLLQINHHEQLTIDHIQSSLKTYKEFYQKNQQEFSQISLQTLNNDLKTLMDKKVINLYEINDKNYQEIEMHRENNKIILIILKMNHLNTLICFDGSKIIKDSQKSQILQQNIERLGENDNFEEQKQSQEEDKNKIDYGEGKSVEQRLDKQNKWLDKRNKITTQHLIQWGTIVILAVLQIFVFDVRSSLFSIFP